MSGREANARVEVSELLAAADRPFFQDAAGPANLRPEPAIAITPTDLDTGPVRDMTPWVHAETGVIVANPP